MFFIVNSSQEVLSAPGNENLNKMYLPGNMKNEELMALVNLVYEGKLQIHKSRFEKIKKTAEYLKIHLPKITEVVELEENVLALLLPQFEPEPTGSQNQSNEEEVEEVEPQQQNEEEPQQQNEEKPEEELINSMQEDEENEQQSKQSQSKMDDDELNLLQNEPEIEIEVGDEQDPLKLIEVVKKAEEALENTGASTSKRQYRKRKRDSQIQKKVPGEKNVK